MLACSGICLPRSHPITRISIEPRRRRICFDPHFASRLDGGRSADNQRTKFGITVCLAAHRRHANPARIRCCAAPQCRRSGLVPADGTGKRLAVRVPLEIFRQYAVAQQKLVEIGTIALGETG
jgi:hypothetical protein